MSQLLHSNRVLLPDGIQPATLEIANGTIVGIATGSAADNAQQLGNLLLMPGCIDPHVHINEPGRAEWEGFETATKAAAAGGITALVDMPLNSSPVATSVAELLKKPAVAKGKLHSNVAYWGGVVPGNLDALVPMIEAGAQGIKAFLSHSGIDEFPNTPPADLVAAMKAIAHLNVPLLVHCELEAPHPAQQALVNDPTSYQAWLQSRPKSWEEKAIEVVLNGCRESGCNVHIVHLSAASALPVIKAAKAEGLPVTVETCPHYVCLDAEDIPDADPRYKCAPPIRERANNTLLRNALLDGTLDFVASDHSPAPPDIKELDSGNIAKAWGGIASVQLTLPLMNSLRMRHNASLEQLATWLCSGPASFMGWEKKGHIAIGCDADLVAWNPEAAFTVNADALQHRHKVTPYHGMELHGVVEHTWLGGDLVYSNGNFPAGAIGTSILRP